MKKRFLAIAIAAGLASPFAANADATVFGKMNISVGTIDTGDTGGVDNFQVRSHASRLGFKGEEDLGNGLTAKFHLEYEVDPDSDNANTTTISGVSLSDGGTAGIKRRNQWVGLKGGFGEVRVGRHDTPLKMAQGKFDQFNDMDGDIKGALSISKGELRVDNAIAYLNKFGDVSVGVALVPGEGDGVTGGDGIADTTSIAVMYSAGPAFVSLAMDQYDDTGLTNGKDGLMRLTGTYMMGKMQFGLMFEQESAKGTANEQDMMAFSFGMGMGKDKVKFQYVNGDNDATEKTMMSLGYDFGLSKRTTAYVSYNDGDAENAAGVTTAEFTSMVAGMIHKF